MKKILIIEDYILEIYLMEEVLKNKYEIKALTDANNTVELIKKYQPDLVILDIIMPNKSGLEIIKEIGTMTKVIVVSSISEKYIKNRVLNLGAKFYLEKPINLSFFKEIIDEELAYIS